MLVFTNHVLIRHCRMVHPTFPLLETFYDSNQRVHVLVDRGEVSICFTKYFNLYNFFLPSNDSFAMISGVAAPPHTYPLPTSVG